MDDPIEAKGFTTLLVLYVSKELDSEGRVGYGIGLKGMDALVAMVKAIRESDGLSTSETRNLIREFLRGACLELADFGATVVCSQFKDEAQQEHRVERKVN